LQSGEIVVEMRRLAAVKCLASSSRKALAITADATDVTAVPDEEDIRAQTGLLGSALQAAAQSRELFPLYVVRSLDHEVDVFRVASSGTDGANQADALDTLQLSGAVDEFPAGVQ
jgi:hypothetical protein